MSKPATDVRLQRAAEGFTQVVGRGNAHIITRNPANGKCAYDCQVGGGWHYGDGLETDTAWEADSDQNYIKMVKAGYNLRARKLFNAGDLIQWTDPVSGQYVKFQPQNFQWIDGTTGSNSLISVAQAVASPSIDDDKLYWPAAFGAGRHFRYIAAPTKLIKHLIIDSAANIPACPSWITNPWLELTFTLTPSSGVTMYVDGQAWNQATAKTTANAIEFRLPSGQVVWSMAAPLAYDSSEMGEPCQGQIKLYVNKKVKYAAVRFPKSWIDGAIFPITLDPTVDYQVGASGDDGFVRENASYFDNTAANLNLGRTTSNIHHTFARFDGVTIPDGATIDSAKIALKLFANGGSPYMKIYAEDAADPDAPTSYSDFAGRSLTTAYAEWSPTYTSENWYDSSSLIGVIGELMERSYASGAAIIIIVKNAKTVAENHYASARSYDYSGNVSGPKLHIEYTEAASGNPFYAYAQQ